MGFQIQDLLGIWQGTLGETGSEGPSFDRSIKPQDTEEKGLHLLQSKGRFILAKDDTIDGENGGDLTSDTETRTGETRKPELMKGVSYGPSMSTSPSDLVELFLELCCCLGQRIAKRERLELSVQNLGGHVSCVRISSTIVAFYPPYPLVL